MAKERKPTTTLEPEQAVELEVLLGLGSRDAALDLVANSRCLDINPWLLDCVAVRVTCLGHQEDLPRAWDWENVLTLLEPGEELLYVLDHVSSDGVQAGMPFTLWLAVRFPRAVEVGPASMERRRKRARVLLSQFQRQAFPGSDISWVDPGQVHHLLDFVAGASPRCVCVSGMPSPRAMPDEKAEADRAQPATRNYQSLNDVAESLVDLRCDYRIAFVVKRVGDSELRDALGWATHARDAIHPFVRSSVEAGANIAANHATQDSKSDGGSRSTPETEGWLPAALNKVRGVVKNRSKVSTDGRSWTHTTGTSSGWSVGSTEGRSREHVRSMVELADRSLERTITALHEAHGTGGYRWAAFVLADGDSADIVGGALEGVLAGSRTKDHPLNRFEVRGVGSEIFQSSLSLIDVVAEASPILSLPRACDALLLPEAELPGVRLRRNVFLGRTCSPPEHPVRLGPVRLGPDAFTAIGGMDDPAQVEIPHRDLFRHVLVAGTTGSGKTTRVVEILNGLEDETLSVVVFETAKRTYRRRVQRAGRKAPLVYTLGGGGEHPGSRVRPLRVNPFFFELGTSLKRHIAVLSDALAELMPTQAMIGPLMRRAVEAAYQERGWDIERGHPFRPASLATWPTVMDFVAQVRTLAQTLNYGPEVTANYRGALENRAALFVDAAFQDIFSHGGNLPIDELLPPGQDVIIEVENLPPSEVDLRAFVMTLLLNRLRATQAVRHSRHNEGRMGDGAAPHALSAPSQNEDVERMLLVVLDECVSIKGGKRKRKKHWLRMFRDRKISVSGTVVTRDVGVTPEDVLEVDGRQVWPSESASLAVEASAPDRAVRADQILEGPRRWLVVIEEAHNVLERSFEERRPADESNAGRTLLRCINRLLQEGREIEVGLMVVDQSPVNLARSVISNTGTKIVMRLEDGAEMEEIGRALGLEPEAWQKLGFLQEGEAIVKASYMDTPVKTAPFPKAALTAGPDASVQPNGDGWVPSYIDLEEIWKPVLSGAQAPDDAWCKRLLTSARGKTELAGFVGLKVRLADCRDDPQAATRTRDFRSAIARPDLDPEMLLASARDIYRASVARLNSAALIGVERLIFRALAAVPAPEQPCSVPIVALGIHRASDLLEMDGIGTAKTWRGLFVRLASGRASSWGPATEALGTYARDVGHGDPTACLRCLVLLRAVATRHPAALAAEAPVLDAVDLLLKVRAMVNPIVERRANDLFEGELERRWAVFGDHLHRQLCLDLARRRGGDAAAELLEMLCLEP